jgi:hypothetical protein
VRWSACCSQQATASAQFGVYQSSAERLLSAPFNRFGRCVVRSGQNVQFRLVLSVHCARGMGVNSPRLGADWRSGIEI